MGGMLNEPLQERQGHPRHSVALKGSYDCPRVPVGGAGVSATALLARADGVAGMPVIGEHRGAAQAAFFHLKDIIRMKRLFAGSLIALIALASTTTASAADGMMCFSTVFSVSGQSGFGTTNYPLLSNSTKFKCGAETTYTRTITSLSQAGWIIDNMREEAVSSTMNSDGTSVVRSRYVLTIQK